MPNQRIVNSSKVAQASALKAKGEFVYIALGSGSASWDTVVQQNRTFVSDTFSVLPTNAYAEEFKVYQLNNLAVEYTRGIDYLFDQNTGICTRLAGGIIASGASVTVRYKAVGLVSATQTQLIDEAARRRASLSYAVLDAVNGQFSIEGQLYAISATPTDLLIATASFPPGELSGEVIRETGLFFDTVPDLTQYTVTKTFTTDKIVIDTDIQNGYKTANNVLVRSQNLATTYVAGTDYILNAETSEVWRLPSGAITGGQVVSVRYDKIASDLLFPADVTSVGTMYAGKTSGAITISSTLGYAETYLIKVTR